MVQPLILVKVRASSQYAACEIQDVGDKRTITFKISPKVRKHLENWRIQLSQRLKIYGIYWKILGVTLYPLSSRDELVRILSSFEHRYYEIIRQIEDEDIRKRFHFSAVCAEFVPLQPYSSEFISQFLSDALEALRRRIELKRVEVKAQRDYVGFMKFVEDAMMDSEERRVGPIFSWGRENLMLFSNIIALLVYAPLQTHELSVIRADLTRLRAFVENLEPGLCRVLDLMASLISKAEAEGNQSEKEILSLIGERVQLTQRIAPAGPPT
jgi:hypothetical protein